jgi:hypothetical protein
MSRRSVLHACLAAGALTGRFVPGGRGESHTGREGGLADLRLPATELAGRAHALVRRLQPPFLLNHSLRSYLFARAVAGQNGLRPGQDFDDELVFLICVLHDIGLTDAANGNQRFEVDGADFAAGFLEDSGETGPRVDTLWDAIALHTTPTIAGSPVFTRRRPAEIRIGQAGIRVDVGGNAGQLPAGYADRVHAAYPRLGGSRALTDAIVAQAAVKPAKATPITFPGEVLHQRSPAAPYTTWDMVLDASGWGD